METLQKAEMVAHLLRTAFLGGGVMKARYRSARILCQLGWAARVDSVPPTFGWDARLRFIMPTILDIREVSGAEAAGLLVEYNVQWVVLSSSTDREAHLAS